MGPKNRRLIWLDALLVEATSSMPEAAATTLGPSGTADSKQRKRPQGMWLQNFREDASTQWHLNERHAALVAADSRHCHKLTGGCCDPTDQYMRALVLILIPAYDAEEWVGTAVGSALG